MASPPDPASAMSGPLAPRSTALLSVPNAFSLARLPLAVAFLLTSDTAVRVGIIVAAGISDFLDGWWARTRGPRTRVGEMLDPVTDKIFVLTALSAFAVWRVITPLELLVMLARDVFVTLGYVALLALRAPVRPRARFPGKLATTLQIGAVLGLTLMPGYARALVFAVGAAGAWAIIDYTAATVREWRRSRLDIRLRPSQPPR
jgi:CDP-diacylglycerol--glycerol-3-phosphate 3-phosphatidyltransferase